MGCLDQQTRQACLEELELPCGYCPKCAKKTEIMGSGVILYFSAITTRQSSPINVPTSQDNIDWWTDPGLDSYATHMALGRKTENPDIYWSGNWNTISDQNPHW